MDELEGVLLESTRDFLPVEDDEEPRSLTSPEIVDAHRRIQSLQQQQLDRIIQKRFGGLTTLQSEESAFPESLEFESIRRANSNIDTRLTVQTAQSLNTLSSSPSDDGIVVNEEDDSIFDAPTLKQPDEDDSAAYCPTVIATRPTTFLTHHGNRMVPTPLKTIVEVPHHTDSNGNYEYDRNVDETNLTMDTTCLLVEPPMRRKPMHIRTTSVLDRYRLERDDKSPHGFRVVPNDLFPDDALLSSSSSSSSRVLHLSSNHRLTNATSSPGNGTPKRTKDNAADDENQYSKSRSPQNENAPLDLLQVELGQGDPIESPLWKASPMLESSSLRKPFFATSGTRPVDAPPECSVGTAGLHAINDAEGGTDSPSKDRTESKQECSSPKHSSDNKTQFAFVEQSERFRNGSLSISDCASAAPSDETQSALMSPNRSPTLNHSPVATLAKEKASPPNNSAPGGLIETKLQHSVSLRASTLLQQKRNGGTNALQPISQSEFQTAPRIIQMQVTFEELGHALQLLNDDHSSRCLTQHEAQSLLESSSTRKTKALLLSLCHFRRLRMRKEGDKVFFDIL